jgi:hypothetical protein
VNDLREAPPVDAEEFLRIVAGDVLKVSAQIELRPCGVVAAAVHRAGDVVRQCLQTCGMFPLPDHGRFQGVHEVVHGVRQHGELVLSLHGDAPSLFPRFADVPQLLREAEETGEDESVHEKIGEKGGQVRRRERREERVSRGRLRRRRLGGERGQDGRGEGDFRKDASLGRTQHLPVSLETIGKDGSSGGGFAECFRNGPGMLRREAAEEEAESGEDQDAHAAESESEASSKSHVPPAFSGHIRLLKAEIFPEATGLGRLMPFSSYHASSGKGDISENVLLWDFRASLSPVILGPTSIPKDFLLVRTQISG